MTNEVEVLTHQLHEAKQVVEEISAKLTTAIIDQSGWRPDMVLVNRYGERHKIVRVCVSLWTKKHYATVVKERKGGGWWVRQTQAFPSGFSPEDVT